MKRALLVIAGGILFLTGVRLVWLHPLWMSQDQLHSWVLRRVPLGSPESAVEGLIAERGWRTIHKWRTLQSESDAKLYPGVRGSHAIGAVLGHYKGLFFIPIDIDAFWGFDKEGRLIDVRVRKMGF